MKWPRSLRSKFVLMLLANLILLGVGLAVFFKFQLSKGVEMWIQGDAAQRIRAWTDPLADALRTHSVDRWPDLLAEFEGALGNGCGGLPHFTRAPGWL